MQILILSVKTIFVYFIVALVFRMMGKREVGQLGTFDLVVFILIAELVAISLEKNGNFIINLVPVLVLFLVQLLMSKISLKNNKFRNLIDGKPIFIIKNGVINFKNMIDQRYTLDDLLLQLREKDIRSLDEVDYAILEINGKLSVFKKDDKKQKNVYPLPIIVDGKVEFNNLVGIKKSKTWLLNTLLKNNLKAEDIFYAFIKKDELYFIKKSDLD